MRIKRKYFNFLLFSLVLAFIIGFIPAIKSNATSTPPTLNAEGAILIDATTGEVLFSKNGDKQFFPASTTKVMTAILVVENVSLDEKVTISRNAVSAEGSSIGLREGEIYTVEDLLKGLLLMSGNDCAVALAEHVSGSVENFALLMNEKAKEIGATQTDFRNPSGLPDKEHLTTPHDLALIMAEAIKHKEIVEISQIISTKLPPSNLDGHELWIANHNYLVNKNSKYYYMPTICGKNGYTIEASHTFTVAASKNGQTLVASFLNASDRNQNYLDMPALFEYGFNNFKTEKIYSKGEEVAKIEVEDGVTVPLLASKDVYHTYENTESKFKKDVDFSAPDLTIKSIKEGDVIVTADVNINGDTITTLDLISGIDKEISLKHSIMYKLKENKIVIIFLLLTAFILFRIYKMKKRKKQLAKKYSHIINRRRDTN